MSEEEKREKKRAYDKLYYQKNKEKAKENSRKYHRANKARANKYSRQYYQEHKEEASAYIRQYYQEHKEEASAYRDQWRKANPEKLSRIRKRAKLRQYNLTLEQYHTMLEQQHNCCALCRLPLEKGKSHVDHDHKTGQVRGIIHSKCNLLLGHADDNVIKLRQSIQYLQRNISSENLLETAMEG